MEFAKKIALFLVLIIGIIGNCAHVHAQNITQQIQISSSPNPVGSGARAIGMGDMKAIIFIILPQAARLAIPGWTNEYTIIIKDSAVTYALGVSEILTRTRHVAERTYQHFWLYILAGLIFLVLTYIGTRVLRFVEEKMEIEGYAR